MAPTSQIPIGETFRRVIERRTIADPHHSVLTLCARPGFPPPLIPELGRRAVAVRDWPALLSSAEEHGLNPLLHTHLRQSAVPVPSNAQRQLLGLYARHRRINDVMVETLGAILDAFRTSGVECLVLKGPALIAQIYEQPALRPLSDLDLLVSESDAVRAQGILDELGFMVRFPATLYRMRRHHHLHTASREICGVPVLVEVHRDALSADRCSPMTFEQQRANAQPFEIAGRVAFTLERHEMLWHLCRHLVGVWHPFRLVWIADIVGYVERFVDELDWGYLRSTRPFVLSTLALVHHITPLPDSVVRRAGMALEPVPDHVACDYRGWPRTTALAWDGWSGRRDFLSRTLAPPEWWLRLNYGAGVGNGGRWVATWRHLTTLTGIVGRRLVDVMPRRHEAPADLN